MFETVVSIKFFSSKIVLGTCYSIFKCIYFQLEDNFHFEAEIQNKF